MPEFIFGQHPIFHALKAGRRKVRKIYTLKEGKSEFGEIASLAATKKVPMERPGGSFFGQFASHAHQGIVAEIEPYPFVNIEEICNEPLLLLCDAIQDPQNLGALCRSALLMGVGGVVITEHSSVSITSGVCKAAAGAVEYLKITSVSSLPNVINLLKKKEFWVYGADHSGQKTLYEESFPEKVALIIGGEDQGLGRLTRERCDIVLKIPMPNPVLGSLNASVAGAIILAEIFRQKSEKLSKNNKKRLT